MSHVFTLTMTNSKVPRWFTEGIAVHERAAASPEWGDRLGPEEIMAVRITRCCRSPSWTRIYPSLVSAAGGGELFPGCKICDFITEKWGWIHSGDASRLRPRRRDADVIRKS